MEKYPHLKLPIYQGNIERKKRTNGGGGFVFPAGRVKESYTQGVIKDINILKTSFSTLKSKFLGKIDPSLIYEIEINQSISSDSFAINLARMGIHVLSRYEDGKKLWIVFSDNENFSNFKQKIGKYSTPIGKQVETDAFVNDELKIDLEESKKIREFYKNEGLLNSEYYLIKAKGKIFSKKIEDVKIIFLKQSHEYKKNIISTLRKYHDGNYDIFNAIESLQDIPFEKKVGEKLINKPLGETSDFIDLELWKMEDYPQRNTKFIQQLKDTYTDSSQFRITDEMTTKSFVLLRVKLTKNIFDEIIQFKEISRADRPFIVEFSPSEYIKPDISDININKPLESAVGILVIDSGIISNHPMLEKSVGGEENFQTIDKDVQDKVGHGTAVAGCAIFGNIEKCLKNKSFNPSNWIFSAKLMHTEKDTITGRVFTKYDQEKLVEHQFKDAVEAFLLNPDYVIKVVNISLGNTNEVWKKNYFRQLPFASLIDELAYTFPNVVFVVSSGNKDPREIYNSMEKIINNYPKYLISDDYRIINPATSALAITVGSIAGSIHIAKERHGAEQIKIPIAKEHQPSPFTRAGVGINGMIKPDLVEYGGNMILSERHGSISEDIGGKIALLNNQVVNDIIKFNYGSSYSAAKVSNLIGKIANIYPQKSANFIKNLLLVGSDYPFKPKNDFYGNYNSDQSRQVHMTVCGYGLSNYDRALNSFDNRAILWDEGTIELNQIKVYSLQLPKIFFLEKGKKKIIVTLTFNPETRSTRGDSYLGNKMEFHLFHSINPQVLIEKFGVISEKTELIGVPEDIARFEIKLTPGINTRKAGCHQKAWKEYKREPQKAPSTPISLVVLNYNKWIFDENKLQDYCISVTFEHEKEIKLYNEIRANIRSRTRIR
jgi:Subtilase family